MTPALARSSRRRSLLALLAITTLAGCASIPMTPQIVVSGHAHYRERIALPPNAVFEATIEDTSRAGAPSTVLARQRIDPAGHPPIAYELSVDPQRVPPQARLAVRARILVDGALWFTTDQVHPVRAEAGAQRVDLLLRRVESARPPRGMPGDVAVPLENTYWKLVALQGQAVSVSSQAREPHLVLQPANRRVVGSGGCNRMSGEYTLDGARLSFGRIAGTRMACLEGMEQESRFFDALGQAAGWRIAGRRLVLLDTRGSVLAAFDAVELR